MFQVGGDQYISNNIEEAEVSLYIPPQRIVHFDLKGAPPTVDYIAKVLTISKELGATGVLLEWEDMFPWSGRLVTFPITLLASD